MLLSSKSKLWLLITVLVGVVTSYLMSQYLSEVKTTAENQVMVPVTVAAKQIPQWTRITPEMLKTVQVPQKSLPEQAVSKPEQAVGQFNTVPLNAEEVVTFTKVASEKTSSVLVYKIPNGYRAITISINPLIAVGGQIKPGNRVDLLMSYNLTGAVPATKVLTLTQNSLVLAIGGGAPPQEGQPAPQENLTLAVTPQEAQYVMLNENIGKMKLALRPVTDTRKQQLHTIDVKTIEAAYK